MREQILNKYNQFLEKFPQEWEDISGLAYTPLRYFYLADVQIKGFSVALDREFEEFHKPQPIDYSEQCYSYCYGFYALIRTCLEVSSKFSNKFQERSFSADLENYRNLAEDKIKEIINIANNCIKHPAGNKDKVTWYEPGGLDSDGKLSINEWSTTEREHFAILTVSPVQDLNTVFGHLERLAELYTKQLAIPHL